MIVMRTSAGAFASPFYPLVAAHRGQVRAVDVDLVAGRRWWSVLLSLSLAAVAMFVLWSDEHETALAVTFVAEHAVRRRLLPVTTLREREIIGLEWHPRLAWDHVLNLAATGFGIGVVGWLGGGGFAAVASVLVMGCIAVGMSPFACRHAGRRSEPS